MSSAPPKPKISSSDRFSFTFILAFAAHAILILGLSFQYANSKVAPSLTVEVVLTKTTNEQEAEDPTVIAEHNQIQSGSVDFDARPSAPSLTQESLQGQSETTQRETAQQAQQTTSNETFIHTESTASAAVTDKQADPFHNSSQQQINEQQKLARLISELNKQEQQYAKRPRINHIDTLSAKTALEARYIKEWVEKVEIIGNIHYPNLARERELSGSLIMSVLVNYNGDIVSSSVQRSSGEKLFDDVAKKVVRLAAPFKKFPAEMKEEYDQIMITRTWVYEHNQKFVTK